MSNQKIDSNQVSFATGGGSGTLTVKEVDGVPTVVDVDTIVVSNGTLTDDGGGQVTLTTGGGGGAPAGSDKAVQYNNASSFGGVTLNATATKKYLQQVSSGTPSFQQVAYSEVSGTPTIPALEVKEADGSPDVNNVTQIIVTNGKLTDNGGGSVSLDLSSGGGVARSGSTTDGHLAVWNGSSADSIKDGGAVPAGTVTSVAAGTGLTGGTITGSGTISGGTLLDAGVNLVIDGGGAAIADSTKYFFAFPWSGTLTGWDLIADQSGSITVDVQDAAYASFPGSASTIFSTKPALSAAQKNQASGLSIAITKGHWAQVVVTGAATVTYCTLALYITRT